MPSFSSVEALKREILRRMDNAMGEAESNVYNIFREYKDEFYNEYSPYEYERTYQLQNSLDRTGVIPTSDGCRALIYYNGEWDYVDEPDDRGWTTDEIVHANMYGHPQHTTAVWANPIERLKGQGEGYEIIKNALNNAGLPVS